MNKLETSRCLKKATCTTNQQQDKVTNSQSNADTRKSKEHTKCILVVLPSWEQDQSEDRKDFNFPNTF